MIRYSIKIALRQLWFNRASTYLSIFGFTVAVAASLVIFKYVSNEFSFDKHMPDHQRIYRLTSDSQVLFPGLVHQLIKEEIADVQEACLFHPRTFMAVSTSDGKNKVSGPVYSTTTHWMPIFQTIVVSGNLSEALESDDKVAISQSTASKLFGTADALGQTVVVNQVFGPGLEKKVVAVYKDEPSTSSIAPIGLFKMSADSYQERGAAVFSVFVKLHNTKNVNQVEKQIATLLQREKVAEGEGMTLQPLASLHLSPPMEYDYINKANKNYLYIFLLIGCIIILVSVINYYLVKIGNVNSASKGIFIHKCNGASATNLRYNLIVEAVILLLISAIVGLALYSIVLPGLINKYFTSVEWSLHDGVFFIGIILLMLLVIIALPKYSIFAGKRVKAAKSQGILQNGLITIQFIITMVLIISSIIIYQQKKFLQHFKTGMDTENVISLKLSSSIMQNDEALRDKLLSHSQIVDVTFASNGPENVELVNTQSEGKPIRYGLWAVDSNFLNFFGINISKGRNFTEGRNDAYAFIVNETAASNYNWSDRFNERIEGVFGKRMVGICSDFHFASLHQGIEPLCIVCNYTILNRVFVKYTGDAEAVVSYLDVSVGELFPNLAFNYEFLDDVFKAYYSDEKTMFELIFAFSLLALLITLIGMIGLATVVTQKRTKEIGIRRVNGARVPELIGLINSKLTRPVFIAFVISIPLVWYIMELYLQNFVQHVPIHWAYFIAGGVSIWLLTTLITLRQTWRAASQNPIKALRYE
ncbi:ABC transporter permease [Carboxylicivirga taeanensis]|uniref:ABC transporter permease n=1 Tax=Carboxylicivirga taeanensis TaxID=1416875 RepID=UPI003F6E167A